jgi:hypothetical protein
MGKKKKKIKIVELDVVGLGICRVIKGKKRSLVACNDLYSESTYGNIPDKKIKRFLKKHKDQIVKVKAKKCTESSQQYFEDGKLKFIELDAVAILMSKLIINPSKVKAPKEAKPDAKDGNSSVKIEVK